MNKLSKIFLVIIIVLIVAVGIMTYLYFNSLSTVSRITYHWYKINEAIEDADLQLETQNDGSFKLVERTEPIERFDD